MIAIDLATVPPTAKVTPAVLQALAEAGRVLIRQFHDDDAKPVVGSYVENSAVSNELEVNWQEPTAPMLWTHANNKDATEHGAYAIAIWIADVLGFAVLGRTQQGSGADWLLIPKNGPENDFYKMEVSGIAEGGNLAIRLDQKATQGRGGNLDRPGRAVVVRFSDMTVLARTWS